MAVPQRLLHPLTSDVLPSCLAEVRRTPCLAPEAEAALGRRIVQGNEHALQELVEGNLCFVVQVVLKYREHGLPLTDLINEGNSACCRAVMSRTTSRTTRRSSILTTCKRLSTLTSRPSRMACCNSPNQQNKPEKSKLTRYRIPF
jgi:hypothetical protein